MYVNRAIARFDCRSLSENGDLSPMTLPTAPRKLAIPPDDYGRIGDLRISDMGIHQNAVLRCSISEVVPSG